MRPEFQKRADSRFEGDNAAYNTAVWEVAEFAAKEENRDAGFYRPLVQGAGFVDSDIERAVAWLKQNPAP